MRTQLRETDKSCLFSYLSSLRKTYPYYLNKNLFKFYFKKMEVLVNKFFHMQKYILGYVNGHIYWERYVIWYDMVCYGMLLYDKIWYDIYDMIWYDIYICML